MATCTTLCCRFLRESGRRSHVRIGTANLLHGRSLSDGLVDTERMVTAIADLGTMIVGLQEVDRYQERSGTVDQTAVIAERMAAVSRREAVYRFAPAIIGQPGAAWTAATDSDALSGHDLDHERGGSGSYGVGLISLVPVESWHVIRLRAAPVRSPILVPGSRRPMLLPDEPRVVLVAVLQAGAAPFRTVATTHLSFVPGWNVRQFRQTRKALAAFPGPRVLLGDLNVPAAVSARTSKGWSALASAPTYPGPDPKIQFDHILTDTPSLSLRTAGRSVVMTISDHRALVADLGG